MWAKNVSLLIVIFFVPLCFTLSAIAELPESVKTIISRADSVSDTGNFQDAFKIYNQAFRLAPDNVEVNFKLGTAAAAVSDYETAVMAFERVTIVDPGFVQAKIEMAKAFYHLGAIETSKQYFTEALEGDLPEEVRRSITTYMEKMN